LTHVIWGWDEKTTESMIILETENDIANVVAILLGMKNVAGPM